MRGPDSKYASASQREYLHGGCGYLAQSPLVLSSAFMSHASIGCFVAAYGES